MNSKIDVTVDTKVDVAVDMEGFLQLDEKRWISKYLIQHCNMFTQLGFKPMGWYSPLIFSAIVFIFMNFSVNES